jgi:large subunit ribosomal protein L7Ae
MPAKSVAKAAEKKPAAEKKAAGAEKKAASKAAKGSAKPAKKADGAKDGKAVAKKAPQGKKKVPLSVHKLQEVKKYDHSIGKDLPVKRDLSRMVRWPKYIRLQRQKAILWKRLTVPPAINQFTHTTDKNTSRTLFNLLNKYRPEEKAAKTKRLRELAKAGGDAAAAKQKKPLLVKFGINHVVALIEAKKAKLVVIAHDVDPIELVIYLPTLCRKLDIPYVIVKGKARLGAVVHQKTATALVVTDVRKEDQPDLAQLVSYARDNFNNNAEIRRTWGGQILGHKSQVAQAKLRKAVAREVKRKANISMAIDAKSDAAPAEADKKE